MSYDSHFRHADDVIAHLNGVIPSLADPLLRVKYIGFVTVAAVTVYELAIKDIFISFARREHRILGHFVESYFDRINGRIRISTIEGDYIAKFGNEYVVRFKELLEDAARDHMRVNRRDLRSAYCNLLTWRHTFAHEGAISTNATYAEVVVAYEDGKTVIRCLAEAML